MTATLIGVVYGVQSLTARRIIVPDAIDGDAYLDRVEANLPAGMAMARVLRSALPQVNGLPDHGLDVLLPAIAQAGGPTITPQKRHVLVDNTGNVIDVFIVDPLLVQPPQVLSQTAIDNLSRIGLKTPITPKTRFDFVQHDSAALGGTIVSGVYTPPVLAVAVGDAVIQ